MNTAAVVAGVGVVILVVAPLAMLVWWARRRDADLSPQDQYRREVSRIKRAAAGGTALGLWAAGSGTDGSGGGSGSGCGGGSGCTGAGCGGGGGCGGGCGGG